jgi:hypothetical protein
MLIGQSGSSLFQRHIEDKINMQQALTCLALPLIWFCLSGALFEAWRM